MIRSVAWFPNQSAQNAAPVIGAVIEWFRRQGVKIVENSLDADAALIWSVLWNGRMKSNELVYKHYSLSSRPVIIVEVGALRRNITWKVAVNNINARGYYGHLDNLDTSRPTRLGITLSGSHNSTPEIKIILQHSKSLQTSDIDVEQWTMQQISLIKSVTDRPIVIRPHPRDRSPWLSKLREVQIESPRPVAGTYDDFDLSLSCHAIINYNSGVGIKSCIAGTRTIVDNSSLAAPVSSRLVEIEQICNVDRELWLTQICHTEYLLDEVAAGSWYSRIEPALGL